MRQLAPGVFVIGRYEPTIMDAKKIGEDILALIDQFNAARDLEGWSSATWRKGAAEVRSPEVNLSINKSSGDVANFWHQDNPRNPGGLGMILWSNREQTEIKLPDDTVLNPEPNNILFVVNAMVHHRTPAKMSEDRWFFRRFVKLPKEVIEHVPAAKNGI